MFRVLGLRFRVLGPGFKVCLPNPKESLEILTKQSQTMADPHPILSTLNPKPRSQLRQGSQRCRPRARFRGSVRLRIK